MKCKPRTLDDVDLELETCIERIRDRVERTERGRVIAVIERKERITIGHTVGVDALLGEDWVCVMTEKPGFGRR